MAHVVIDNDLYIHRVDDLSTFVAIYLGAMNEDIGVAGKIRRYANGFTRAVTTPGQLRTVRVTMPFLARADLLTLEDWAGIPVMVRDPVGRKLFGVFFTIDINDRPISESATVVSAGFTLQQLTLSEEV